MVLKTLFYTLLFATCLPFGKSQQVLQQGVVLYKSSRLEKLNTTDSEEMEFYFGPKMSVLKAASPQGEGAAWMLFDDEKSRTIMLTISAADTTVLTYSWDVNAHLKSMNGFELKPARNKKKKLLGYDCTYLRIKKSNPSPIKIKAWVSTQIQSKKCPPVIDLNLPWPGFPLEFQLEDPESGDKLLFKAQWIKALPDSLLEIQKNLIESIAERCAQRKQKINDERITRYKENLAFLNDTTIHWVVQTDTLWEVLQTNSRAFTMESKRLAARCTVSREALQQSEDPEKQMEELLERNQNYLVVLQSPRPEIQTMRFRGAPSKQQIWNFHKRAVLEKDLFPKEYNPYNFLPLEDLVEIHQTFNIQGIIIMMNVQTTIAHTAEVMGSVFRMLETLEIKTQ